MNIDRPVLHLESCSLREWDDESSKFESVIKACWEHGMIYSNSINYKGSWFDYRRFYHVFGRNSNRFLMLWSNKLLSGWYTSTENSFHGLIRSFCRRADNFSSIFVSCILAVCRANLVPRVSLSCPARAPGGAGERDPGNKDGVGPRMADSLHETCEQGIVVVVCNFARQVSKMSCAWRDEYNYRDSLRASLIEAIGIL